ncbi:magnesium transporter CorA family protein [soil metagenome]
MVEIFKKTGDELIRIEQAEPGCWINIYPPFNHENLEDISNTYNIPLDFLIDSLDINERSRYEYEDDVKLIVLNTPVDNEDELVEDDRAVYVTVPIGIILLPEMILTLCQHANPVIDSFMNQRVKRFNPADRQKFVLQLFDRSVFYFLHYLRQINNKRNLIEDELYNSSRNTELAQFMNLQKSLVYFVNTLRGNELMMAKMGRTDFLQIKSNEDLSDYLEDIIVDNSQALEMSNVYTNILNGTMDAFASIISNNLNTVMQRLTSITIVLMVPTLVASFYGMNVELPFQHLPGAFAIIVSISLILSLILVMFFRRKKWF